MGSNYGSGPSIPGITQGGNIAAGLAYLFGFVSGIIVLLVAGTSDLARFSAVQSILLSVAWFIVRIVLGLVFGILAYVPVLNVLVAIVAVPLNLIVTLAFLIAWLFSMVRAFQGQATRLPVLGALAQKYARVA